jgi:H+/Cl- antiporter ClcA
MEPLILWMDPTPWLEADAIFPPSGDQGKVHFPEDYGRKSLRGFVRTFLFKPIYPEFTSLQQFVWSIIIGVAMGFYTAFWKYLIDGCVDVFWVVVPTFLRNIGFFTDIQGNLPMTHYMWICPTVFGSSLSYIFASLSTKIPGQNQWIQNVHSKGVQESDTFLQLFLLSTLGMASGLSLGPELPLVLTAGMVGSYLGIMTKQSVLQARVLNLVAASSAVGGFFGFPMAGALFVLEIPHRMGLQYFEALSPAIFGSIVAVLTNRMVINNDVTGYYKYPFLTDTLPSTIFWHAII